MIVLMVPSNFSYFCEFNFASSIKEGIMNIMTTFTLASIYLLGTIYNIGCKFLSLRCSLDY